MFPLWKKYRTIFFCSAQYDSQGGRRSRDLIHLANFASAYTHILVIVGDNDVNSDPVENILGHYNDFSNAVWPSHVKFAGHMRRKDLDADLVAYNNTYLSQNLGNFFKSTKLIKRNDFDDDTPYHFNVFGEGYRHLAALIYSVLREFNDLW